MSDRHVVPSEQDHDPNAACWCQPITDYVEPVTGARVWLHRRANDLPHYERRLGAVPSLCQCPVCACDLDLDLYADVGQWVCRLCVFGQHPAALHTADTADTP